uniref:Uncharacterized protein n=1 Tax=Tetranychus urticae TaxID=32264 RepID=T1KR90_TETUR
MQTYLHPYNLKDCLKNHSLKV